CECCIVCLHVCFFFFSSRRRHTRSKRDWSSDVCSSDLKKALIFRQIGLAHVDLHQEIVGGVDAGQLLAGNMHGGGNLRAGPDEEIGRASCRERAGRGGGEGAGRKREWRERGGGHAVEEK